MINFEILSEKFHNNVREFGDKLIVEGELLPVLEVLKNISEFSYDMLLGITAIDLQDKIELIYHLYSTSTNLHQDVCVFTNDKMPSVTAIYKSAGYDECEIFDMFGINFECNQNLHRLYMPDSWVGHPLLKSYKNNDERLVWND